jgi:hypothetical protein
VATFEDDFNYAPIAKPQEAEPYVSTAMAAIRQENIPGSYLSKSFTPGEIDESFEPFSHIKDTKYERYIDKFANVFSEKEMYQLMSDIDREERDRQALAEAGMGGLLLSIAAGTIDPTIFLPGALPVKAGMVGAKVGRGLAGADDIVRGMSAPAVRGAAGKVNPMAGAANVAAGATLGASVQELGLHQTQELRTIEESVFGVATATILGGILGTAVSGLSKAQLNALAKDLHRSTAQPGMFLVDAEKGAEIAENTGVFIGEESTVGAMRTKEGTYRLKDEKAIKASKWGKVSNLVWNLLMDSDAVRKATAKLSDGGMMKADSEQFITGTNQGTVENGIKLHRRKLYDGVTTMDEAFVRYYTNGNVPRGPFATTRVKFASELERWGGTKSGRMNYQEFRREIGKAMAREDKHAVPEIQEAAKAIREKVFKPMKEELMKAKGPDGQPLLHADTDDKYITRLYNREIVSARRGDLKAILVENFKNNQESLAAEQVKVSLRLEKIEADIARVAAEKKAIKGRGAREKQKPLQERLEKLRKEAQKVKDYREKNFIEKEGVEIETLADEVIDHILGNSYRTPGIDIIAEKRGPLKARVLRVDDEFTMMLKGTDGSERSIAFEDFLERDIEKIMNFYVRSAGSDVELAKAFDGDIALERTYKEILEEKNAKIQKLTDSDMDSAAREKQSAQIEKDYDRAWRNLQAFRDRLRGTYLLPDNPDGIAFRAERIALNLNYLRLLGGMTISAFPDIARHVMVNGLGPTMRSASLLINDLNAWKMGSEEIRKFGLALDMVLDSRTRALADLHEDFQSGSAIERAIQGLSNNFGIVSLMAPWNAVQKQLAGITTMDRILRAVKDFNDGKITQKQIQHLADAGIDETMARKIWKEMENGGGSEVKGVWLSNTDSWKDKRASRAFSAAVVREVERTIVTPGLERPNFMSASFGRIIGQFKSFGLSSVNQTLIAGLQQRDANFYNGVVMAVALGMVAGKVKAELAGRETDHWTKEKWLVEGLDRSGVWGVLADVNNIAEKVSRGRIGLSAFTGEMASRYQSRNLISSLIGPTGGLIEDFGHVTGSLAAGDWRQSDTHRMRQLLPYQNLLYFRNTLNAIEHSMNDLIGVDVRENQ